MINQQKTDQKTEDCRYCGRDIQFNFEFVHIRLWKDEECTELIDYYFCDEDCQKSDHH